MTTKPHPWRRTWLEDESADQRRKEAARRQERKAKAKAKQRAFETEPKQ